MDNITARLLLVLFFQEGVLEVTLPKSKNSKTTVIPISLINYQKVLVRFRKRQFHSN